MKNTEKLLKFWKKREKIGTLYINGEEVGIITDIDFTNVVSETISVPIGIPTFHGEFTISGHVEDLYKLFLGDIDINEEH